MVEAGLADGSSELVMCALGGALWQLKRSLIDYEVLSLGKIRAYVPPEDASAASAAAAGDVDVDGEEEVEGAGEAMDVEQSGPVPLPVPVKPNVFAQAEGSADAVAPGPAAATDASSSSSSSSSSSAADDQPTHMVLDAVALGNLEELQNNYDRTEKGSLWAFVNRTKTPFGARLLKEWLCRPLFRAHEIRSRAAAVDELMGALSEASQGARKALGHHTPDLERLLARVHSNGLKKKGSGQSEHPDARAIMYETPIYNGRKIKDFADVLTGFETVLAAMGRFDERAVVSPVLRRLVATPAQGGLFPRDAVTSLLQHFRTIFDEKQAKKDGNIKPKAGVDAEYDRAKGTIGEVERALEEHLREMKRATGIQDMKYFGNNKDRYQLEVPIAQSSKVPKDWQPKSQKKTHRRYRTPEIEDLFARLVEAEEAMGLAQKDTLRRVFEKFDESRQVWCGPSPDLLSLVSHSLPHLAP